MGLFAALKSDKARFKKLHEEGCVVTLSVEIPGQQVAEQTQESLARIQNRARVPGFRAGKAPLGVVRQHFSAHAREEAVDSLMRKHVPMAIEELKLRVVDTPSVQDVKWSEGAPLFLTVRVEVAPAATAKDYLKIQVTRKPTSADAIALEKRLEDLRQSHSRLEVSPDDAVGETHFAVIDYSATQHGKPVPQAKGAGELVDMSAEQSIDGLVDGLKGMRRGESKALPVKLRGHDALLTITLKEIKSKVLPALDAELSKDLGFETLDALKSKLKEVLDAEARKASDEDSLRQIESALVKSNPFPLPPSMVERQLQGMFERMQQRLMGSVPLPENVLSDLKNKLQPRAEEEVRLAFIFNAIAEKEKIEATDAEVRAELEAGLRTAEDEQKKKELQELFERRKDQIAHMIRERKVVSFLKDKALYKDA